MTNQITVKQAFESVNVKNKFNELLGKRSTQFITSVLATVNSNKLLQNANWETIYQAAITAATLDLPINPNLGFAYIIPYNREAQFQVGYKGFIQLAQRSGSFKTINVSDVREGEIDLYDRLTGQIKFNWIQNDSERIRKPIVGYVAYFELLNGFNKLQYMTINELEAHGKAFSKSFNKKNEKGEYTGLWRTNFDSMAKKTVIKLLLSKYGPLSTEMQTAMITDQAVMKDDEVEYIDNDSIEVEITEPKSELQKFIEDEVSTVESLVKAVEGKTLTESEQEAFDKKYQELDKPEPETPTTTEDGALLPENKKTTKI